ncbi:MAG: hypothetical protein H0W25_15710 [Acidimicrobiia bacterium]|nr:hypothetical protein [Acidimicrobiia bacterium]
MVEDHGAVAGAAAGIVTGLVTGDMATGATIGSVAAVGGGVVGGLAGTYKDLPANPEAFETYEVDPNDPRPVSVTVRPADDAEAEAARSVLGSS